MGVLATIAVFQQVKTVLDLPMAKNRNLKFLRRNDIRIKTAHIIASFKRWKFPWTANLLIKTNHTTAARYVQLLTYILRRPKSIPNS